MSAEVIIWESSAGSKFCVLGGLHGVPDEHEIKRGKSRVDGFPQDAHFKMDKRFPKQVALADSLSNLEGMVVISAPLKGLIEVRSPGSVELLPVSIINHKGRVASNAYWIVNPLRIVDCIEKDQSEIDWNAIDPTLISGCMKLVLDAVSIPDDVALFRPRHMEHVIVVGKQLADEIVSQGFTGVDFTKIESFEM